MAYVAIGVGASKFLGVQRIFAQIFPNLPKSFCAAFADRFLMSPFKKWTSLVFLQTLGDNFLK